MPSKLLPEKCFKKMTKIMKKNSSNPRMGSQEVKVIRILKYNIKALPVTQLVREPT